MDTIPQQILLQLILIFLNAFFAATEIAVISLNGAKLRKEAEEGNKKSARLLKMVEEPSGFLSTIQIGITLAGFLGSAFAADNFSGYLVNWVYDDLGYRGMSQETLNTISVIVITIILSYVTLILGELVPKRIAMQKPYEIAKFTSGVVSAVATVMKPVIIFLSLSTNAVLKLLRMKTETEEESVTEEELKMMIELGGKKGVLDKDESDWIKNVFEFDDITVEEVMTQRSDMVTVDLDDDEEKILETIRESKCSRIPVYDREKDEDDIVGILHAKDYLLAGDEEREKGIEPLMRQAYFVSENMKASELFKKMQLNNMHMAIVVDEYGSINGLVTMEDLLEEIVGSIYDETDIPEVEEDIVQLAENKWKLRGDCSIKKFEAAADYEIETDNNHYVTMGGLVIEIIDEIPEDGKEFDVEIQDLKIHVLSTENRRISEMIVEKTEKTIDNE
ncbi:hemolysin family protein [Gallibacter intestinalis]|uniref:HlyC/CorC family transporter n=1 Tax=Gallibacter intestinalis TaxID=2779356 RepID=A0ABR9QVC9_9FIRM|nr:hemolysin family protein [Gallibacter intestinalis]MBE5034823.1 HlyC/CorC family transporter [Gallibacter intestinalis]